MSDVHAAVRTDQTHFPVLQVAGERLVLDPSGAVFWPDHDTLIVSDLHFEKGSAMAARGALLPPYDTRATLSRLTALVGAYRPSRLISLGDAFHDSEAAMRLAPEDLATLKALQNGLEWVWILGNHRSI